MCYRSTVVTKSYSVERTIDARPQRVWELLTDADGYPGVEAPRAMVWSDGLKRAAESGAS